MFLPDDPCRRQPFFHHSGLSEVERFVVFHILIKYCHPPLDSCWSVKAPHLLFFTGGDFILSRSPVFFGGVRSHH